MAHLALRQKQQILINKLEQTTPDFKDIANDDIALQRVEDYIASKHKMGPKAPANITPEEVGSISAHGTGTLYNDSMEMRAFKTVFSETGPIPIYSVKGGTGHTMGAAGLVEACVGIKSLSERIVPSFLV